MLTTTEHITSPALALLGVLLMGTSLLIAVAFLRRWQQIGYANNLHLMRRRFRPFLARVLAGAHEAADLQTLLALSLTELELLTDPLLTHRKLSDRQLLLLRDFCEKAGLIDLWQRRIEAPNVAKSDPATEDPSDAKLAQHVWRAKSIRNLGKLRHQPSWAQLVHNLDDREEDIRLLTLRSLGSIGAPGSFPILLRRLHTEIQSETTSVGWRTIMGAMINFDLACAPALLPLLQHPGHRTRLAGIEILGGMVYRESTRHASLALTSERLSPALVDTLLTALATDVSAKIRARAGEIAVFLADPRATHMLRNLLYDDQWLVRQHTVMALSRSPRTAGALHLQIRQCLRDPHRQVRESAIQTLIALGVGGQRELFLDFLTSRDHATSTQIVEVIERTGLMSTLVEEYSKGTHGVDALVVEYLASDTAPFGLSAVLRTLHPDVRRKFLDRFIPSAEPKLRLTIETLQEGETESESQPMLDFPPLVTA